MFYIFLVTTEDMYVRGKEMNVLFNEIRKKFIFNDTYNTFCLFLVTTEDIKCTCM